MTTMPKIEVLIIGHSLDCSVWILWISFRRWQWYCQKKGWVLHSSLLHSVLERGNYGTYVFHKVV